MERFSRRTSVHFEKAFPSTESSKFGVLESHGDGSCFFHSVVAALTEHYDQMKPADQVRAGRTFRRAFLDLMNEQLYANAMHRIRTDLALKGSESILNGSQYSYNEFRKRMLNFRTWADATIISSVALLLQLNIVFFDGVGQKLYYGVDNFRRAREKKLPTILVEWQDRSHFNLIVRVTQLPNNKTQVDRQFFFDRDSDNAFLERLERMYKSS